MIGHNLAKIWLIMQGLGFFWNTVYVNIYVTGKKTHRTYWRWTIMWFIWISNMSIWCLLAFLRHKLGQPSWEKSTLQHWIGWLDFKDGRPTRSIDSTPTSNDRLDRSISGSNPNSKETGLTQCSIVQIIHRDLGLKCLRLPTRLLIVLLAFLTFIFHEVVYRRN